MSPQKMFRWRPTRRQLRWAGGIAALAFLIIMICGYVFGWDWTGFPRTKVPQNVQPTKTLWDWLDLLIVPVVLAIGGYLFNSSQNRATQEAAEQRAQDDALQAYLDDMSDMMIPDKDQPSLYDENSPESLRFLARARTLTVLSRLNDNRKGRVMQFLQESRLIHKDSPVLSLYKADLRGIVLRGSEPWRSDLGGANLSKTDLREADLSWADLSGANLSQAMLHKTDLSWADLSGANLSHANLSHANLYRAVLREANLTLVWLTGTDLREAYLGEAYKITWEGKKELMPNEELEDRAKTPEGASMLEGATMPDGRKYEDWLRDKEGSGKDAETE